MVIFIYGYFTTIKKKCNTEKRMKASRNVVYVLKIILCVWLFAYTVFLMFEEVRRGLQILWN